MKLPINISFSKLKDEQAAFVALAALNVGTVLVAFGLSAFLVSRGADAAAVGRVWADRIETITELADVAEAAGAAAAFDGADLAAARLRKDAAIAEFDEGLRRISQSLNADAGAPERSRVVAALGDARAAMTRMSATAELAFRSIERNDRHGALTYLRASNTATREVTDHLFEAVREAQVVQSAWLAKQQGVAAGIRGVLLASGALILALVLLISWRGAHVARANRRNAAELSQARKAADAANERKTQFLASMSHELRTPLNAIIGYSELMREGAEIDRRRHDEEDHDRVIGAARRLLGLINEILDLTKIEAGKMEASIEDVDVPALVREAVDAVRLQAEANGDTLELELEPGLGLIRSDGLKLSQCLINLLSNAAKFTKDGAITVRVHGEGARIVFEVEDTGIGIAEDKAASLFQPFVQADASITRAFGGTGLGLAITREIARLLGGDVTMRSRLGHGSTFRLEVARALDGAAPQAAESAPMDGAAVVVVIDDDPLAHDLIARTLAPVGFDVRAAMTGAAGLDLVRAAKPALLLVDIELTDMSGWQVLEHMHADPGLGDTPAIVVSVDDDRARALSLGACDHMTKPIKRDALAAKALRFARRSAPPAEPSDAPRRKSA